MSDLIDQLADLLSEQLTKRIDVGEQAADSATRLDVDQANALARALHDASIQRGRLQAFAFDDLLNELADRLFQRLQIRQVIQLAIKNQRKRVSLVHVRGRFSSTRYWSVCSAGRAARRSQGL